MYIYIVYIYTPARRWFATSKDDLFIAYRRAARQGERDAASVRGREGRRGRGLNIGCATRPPRLH